jgi:NAD(P)-dependent dehydrogenase (short-subunit alcohol dehydrogenase family)
MKLDNTIAAIVTGGASGLGAATARALAERGVKVTIFDLDAVNGEKTAQAISARFVKCDVTDEGSVEAAIAAARAANGQERVLVNCAGIAIGKRTARRVKETGGTEPHDVASFAKVVAINLVGTFGMIAKCSAGMLTLAPLADNERGVIVNTSSIAAEDGQMGQVAYAASKGGVAAMTLPVARDLARDGIRCVSIMPGLFETPMFAGLPEDARAALAATVPFPSRLGNPAEYATLAVHICENVMLNGSCIRLDGANRLPAR